MGKVLDEQVIALFNDQKALKVLATTDPSGEPHVVFKGSLQVDEKGDIIYLELLESSRSNRNLVNSIWFKRKVAINVKKADDGLSYQVKGIPVRCIISGPIFERYYRQAQQRDPQADLAAVWVIRPESVREETYTVRRTEEASQHPLLLHLDRLVKLKED